MSRPAHEVRIGRVKAVIWKNDTSHGPKFNVAVSRLFKDDDEWKQGQSFGRDDLPLLAKVADQAHTWIFENQ